MTQETTSRLVDIAIACAGGAVRSGAMEGVLLALGQAVNADGAGYYETMPGGELRLSSRYGLFDIPREMLHSSQWVQLLGNEPLHHYRVKGFKGSEYPFLFPQSGASEMTAMAVFFMRESRGIGMALLVRINGECFALQERSVAEQAGRLLCRRWSEPPDRNKTPAPVGGPRMSLRDLSLDSVQDQIQKRERIEALAELAGKLSHEIRNPLGTMRNALYCLSSRVQDPDSTRYVGLIQREILRCTSVIDELLEFTQAPQPAFEREDLNGILEDMMGGLEIPDGVRIEYSYASNLPSIRCDKALIMRAVGNLMRNALDGMSGGGVLRLSTRCDHELCEIIIEDTGTGIRPDQLDRIFDPFFTTKGKGLGLGLVSSLNIVQAHGGTITASSTPGKGSVFTVKLSRKGAAP